MIRGMTILTSLLNGALLLPVILFKWLVSMALPPTVRTWGKWILILVNPLAGPTTLSHKSPI